MDKQKRDLVKETYRQALYLWGGLCLALTLFFVQSQVVFVKGKPLPTSQLEYVFSGLGVVTFLMGYFFFNNYTSLRKNYLMKMPVDQRKQNILVAYVIQFVMFESLGLYGVLLSVLTKNSWKALPFMVFAYLGFGVSFPKKHKISSFFRN